ncbi:alpha/beta fold hydrolase [Shewanella cyperi]|uniref:alpha/beta fold hydrolase n=1 Tax=Shewanella cyperi TaxID=2814292 RepID=UPI001A94D2E3|nr:alpha/beta hydrolase [Shewanella cyperi]QSX40077.1 alpha/beta hydrolase [Shewanella cyperi]
MKHGLILATLWLSACAFQPAATDSPPYGHNAAAASRHNVNGTSLYVETYGEGEPLLLLHGNGDSLAGMKHQIAHFAKRYRVIAVDSRGHGQTPLATGALTYELIASDIAALLKQLGLGPVKLIGWSDGGIVGLWLALTEPDAVSQMAIMGVNIAPDGAYDWDLDSLKAYREQIEHQLALGDRRQDWPLLLQRVKLMDEQTPISHAQLQNISAPTLVMAGDEDVIRPEHTLAIYRHLPRAQLAIFPGATHMLPSEAPDIFNAAVERFFSEPFRRPTTRQVFQGEAQEH